jgi:hypothetical protein
MPEEKRQHKEADLDALHARVEEQAIELETIRSRAAELQQRIDGFLAEIRTKLAQRCELRNAA